MSGGGNLEAVQRPERQGLCRCTSSDSGTIRAMRSKMWLSCALAVLLLCGMLQPAFADGALGAFDALGPIMIVGVVIVVVIVIFIVLRALDRRGPKE
jgi:predicted anti-sigma-YlaC factor YlaD